MCIIKSVCILVIRLTLYQIPFVIIIISQFKGNPRSNPEVMTLNPKQCQVYSRHSINICSVNGFIPLKKSLTSGSPLVRIA